MSRVLIAGCGDVGGELAWRLLADGLEVYGLRRRVYLLPAGVRPIAADLLITDGGRTRTVDAAKGEPALQTRGATASRASGCSPPSCLATWARAQLAVRLHAEIPTDEISRGRRQHPDVRRSVNGRAALSVGARGRRWGRTASMVPHPGPVACRDARLGEERVLGSHHPRGRMAGAFTRRSRPFPAGTPSRSCPRRVHVPRSPGRCSESLNDGIELRAVAVPVEREAAAAAVSAGRAC